MTADHAERVREFLDAWTAVTPAERIEWVRVGNRQVHTRQVPLTTADLAAVLDELKQLRASEALLVRRLRDAYRSGWDDWHYSAVAALGLASSNRDFLSGQHVARVLGEAADAAERQPEHDDFVCLCGRACCQHCGQDADEPCPCQQQPEHDGAARTTITEAFHDPKLIKPERDESEQR